MQAGPAQGSVLTFAERFPNRDGNHTGWMHPPLLGRAEPTGAKSPPAWTNLSIQSQDGYDLTDCVGMPDGSIVLLERRFRLRYGDLLTGPKMRLRRVTQAELTSGTMISGETLFAGDTRYEIDNMEGLAVHVDAHGATVLTLISDDNFNTYLQRTVLLQFALIETPPAPVAAPALAAEQK